MAMNKDTAEGNWHQMKGEIKRQWGKLTDDEIDRTEGDFEKLAGHLQEKYGYSKEEAKQRMDEFRGSQPPH